MCLYLPVYLPVCLSIYLSLRTLLHYLQDTQPALKKSCAKTANNKTKWLFRAAPAGITTDFGGITQRRAAGTCQSCRCYIDLYIYMSISG